MRNEKKLIEPTYRHMKWWWRVHLAAPKLGKEETLQLVINAETYNSGVIHEEQKSITETLADLKEPTIEDNKILNRIIKARTREFGHSIFDHFPNRLGENNVT